MKRFPVLNRAFQTPGIRVALVAALQCGAASYFAALGCEHEDRRFQASIGSGCVGYDGCSGTLDATRVCVCDATTNSTGPVEVTSATVGSPCSSDAYCRSWTGEPDLRCYPSTSNEFPGLAFNSAGGPAGGYCSRPCSPDAPCGRDSECVALSPQLSLCLADCRLSGVSNFRGDPECRTSLPIASDATPGTGPYPEPGPQACIPLSVFMPDDLRAMLLSNRGVCMPLCAGDEDCGGTRHCDPSSGLCVDEPPSGGDIGAACKVESAVDDCKSSFCLPYVEGDPDGICTAPCAYLADGCGSRLDSPRPMAACFASSESPNAGALGLCWPLCDVDADCRVPGRERDECAGPPLLNRQGTCALPAAPGPEPASGDDRDAAGDAGMRGDAAAVETETR
jgi:hypothetical protein